MNIKTIHFDSIDSTNTWAKLHFEELDPTVMTVITADEQTAGRGRWRRKWVSPKGVNLLVTFAFYLDSRRTDIGNIPQILALSAAKVIRSFGLQAQIKWPNDLQISKKKIGGILCETVQSGKGVGVIVGIGINVNMDKEDVENIDIPATSMKVVSGKTFDRDAILQKLIETFNLDLQSFLKNGFKHYFNEYLSYSSLVAGTPIIVNVYPQKYPGHFHHLNEDGSLTFKNEQGHIQTTQSGEILEQS